MLAHQTDQLSCTVGDRQIPQIICIHRLNHIDCRRICGCTLRICERNIRNGRFNTENQLWCFHTKLLQRVPGLGVQVPAAGGDVLTGSLFIEVGDISYHTADTVRIRVTVADNIDGLHSCS